MRFAWHIEPDDIAKVRAFVNAHCNGAFVKQRIAKNLSKQKPPITEEEFWECLVACLLTTQQKSGPKSKVTQFIATRPFPLRYDVCMSRQDDLLDFAQRLLAEFGGLRCPWRQLNALARCWEWPERGRLARFKRPGRPRSNIVQGHLGRSDCPGRRIGGKTRKASESDDTEPLAGHGGADGSAVRKTTVCLTPDPPIVNCPAA